ncbi:MAG: hypothetical protein HGB04_05735, partial [Chlorobiaceae bacterium]|nr:hypothetical protein [Chlorobiaceae bacterium]
EKAHGRSTWVPKPGRAGLSEQLAEAGRMGLFRKLHLLKAQLGADELQEKV